MLFTVNKLDPTRVQQFLREHPGWTVEAGALVQTYDLPTFLKAIDFVTRVAQSAEAKDHHPDIDIRWKKVTLRWVTHDAGGLTELDTALAAQCDLLVG